MVGRDGSTVDTDAPTTGRLVEAELLGSDDEVMPPAQISCVTVDIKAAEDQWHLMVHNRGGFRTPFG